MNVVVFHGSPRKGNTYHATTFFMNKLAQCGNVNFIEFYLPKDLPAFCIGCTLCFSGRREKCPNSEYVTPIVDAIIKADALVFATPHYGACSMSGAMKNLLDHLDFMVLNVSPMEENFSKKAFIITTGAGSTAAINPIRKNLKHWGINRVYALGLRLFTDKWGNMPEARQQKFEKHIKHAAIKFYNAPKSRPYISTIMYYHMTKLILRRYVGEGKYPYELWKQRGYFRKRPF